MATGMVFVGGKTGGGSNGAAAGDIQAHNEDPNAHSSILGDISRLTSEVETLSLRVNTNITANPFSVTFKTLDGLIVSGVHNTSRGTIDF